MSRQQQTSTWPFLLVLAGLFALSILAPRGWRKIAIPPRPPSEATKSRRLAIRRPAPERPAPAKPLAAVKASDEREAADAHEVEPQQIDREKASEREVAPPASADRAPPQPQPRKVSAHQEPRSRAKPLKEVTNRPAALPPLRPLELSEPQAKIANEIAPLSLPAPAAVETISQPEVAEPDEVAKQSEPSAELELPAERETPAADDRRPESAEDFETPPLPEPRAAQKSEPARELVAKRPERKSEQPDLRVPASAPAEAAPSVRADRKPAQRKESEAAPPAVGFWESPDVLLANLERLSLDCDATEWATQTIDRIRALCALERPDSPRARQLLDELQALASRNHPLRAAMVSSPSAAPWRRVAHALSRRLKMWQLAPAVAQASRQLRPPASAERSRLSSCLAQVAALTESGPAGAAWREYLQWETLEAMAARRLDAESERRLALSVLQKLEQAAFDERQRDFIASSPLAALDRELHHWIAEPVDARRMLEALEQFELLGQQSDGRALALAVRQISAWPGDVAPHARGWLEENYRNSNLRISFTAELLNRMVPKQEPIKAPVRDRILGAPTHGWSTTTADLGIRLIPDARRVHVSLEVTGQVSARTTSRSGPATLHSQSDAEYLAYKEVTVGLAGVRTQPAYADASNNPHLQAVETDYDDVPLLGSLIGLTIETVARVKHAEQENAVRRIARQRVTSRVQAELDAAVEAKLKQANANFQERVLAPLSRLQLEPSVIAMQTTEDRVTLRLRMATDEQLAASTPRPQALAGSLASVQIHQSLLNNVGEQLQLDGRSFSLPELQKHLADILGLDPATFSEEYPADMRIAFADHDSAQVRFISGRVMLRLSIAELRNYPGVWRDFQVRAFYKPVRHGLELRFVRDGTVQLWGERFGAQPQIALRGIFSRVFSQDRQLSLLDPKLAADPRLAGLEVTQCLTTDGWLGLSIGVRRPARTASLKQ